jgi:hypothetical protein
MARELPLLPATVDLAVSSLRGSVRWVLCPIWTLGTVPTLKFPANRPFPMMARVLAVSASADLSRKELHVTR